MIATKVWQRTLGGLWVRTDVDYFRGQAFMVVVIALTLAAWIWLALAHESERLDSIVAILLALVLGGVVWAVSHLYQTRFVAAVALLLFAQIFFIGAIWWFTGDASVAYLSLLPIVMGGILLGLAGTLMATLSVMLMELTLMTWISATYPGAIAYYPTLSVLFTYNVLGALIAWQASLGLYAALDSAENSAQAARKHAQEAGIHRAELQRILKSLDLANHQLERANAELFFAREVADAALRFKSEFAAELSHELRTSLNLILGFSETMSFAQHSYGCKLPSPYLRDVTEIYRNSRHLLALIDDILDLSKLEAGHMGLYREKIDMGVVIQEAAEIVQPLLSSKGVSLQVVLTPELPLLQVDYVRIRQVLLNLLSNAARVTQAGFVQVMATIQDEELVVSVRDTGPGIEAELLEAVFQEFRQLDGSKGSTGLGLALSRRIVGLHGGRMWATSNDTPEAKGACFFFTLPLEQPANLFSQTKGRPILPHRAPQPSTIIIDERMPEIDSDEVKLLKRHLDGFLVVTTEDESKAATLVRQVSARAVIRNTVEGEEVPLLELPVPLITCALPGPQTAAVNIGIDYYLQKPITVQAVQAALEKAAPGAKRLLIVDDDPSAVRLLERMVRAVPMSATSGAINREGEERLIYRAYSGKEALVRIQAQPLDVVLLDFAMADGDGWWLISQLRRSHPQLALIVVSGRAAEEAWHCKTISIHSAKGFTPTEVLNYLKGLLATTAPAPVERYTSAPTSSIAHPV